MLVDAPLYKKLLLFYGAKKVDMDLLESGTIHAKVARDPIPVMEHRQIAFHRMLIEHKDNHDLEETVCQGCRKLAPLATPVPANHIWLDKMRF